MKHVSVALLVAVLMLPLATCARAKRPSLTPMPLPPGASLWQSPGDLGSRDLFYGPWGRRYAPDPTATYTLKEFKHSGVNSGMTVIDELGREWSVKQPYPGNVDNEARVEVAVSRLLSAVGYHQPPVYYLRSFTLRDDWGTHVEVGGRFRLKHDALKETGSWAWADNPFVRTRQYQGLLSLLMMFNSTDLKNSNNSLYERRVDGVTEQWYLVRDLGAALGDTSRIAPLKGNADAFERHPFIAGVTNGYVDFAYSGWYRKLVDERITPADVAWASELLGRLTERQWSDAFRAAGYGAQEAGPFIRKLRAKVEQGRAVARPADN
jgi:hypothetical protein